VKTLHIASILAFAALSVFACSDDDDATKPSVTAGAGGEAPSVGGSDSSAGNGDGGLKASGGEGGSTSGGATEQGGASEPGGAGGQGGAPVACDESLGGAGGAGGAGPDRGAGLEIIGTWKEGFGGELEITSTHWNSAVIHAYDNDTNVVYTQSPCDSMYFPGAFSKYVYIEPTATSFYYCTVIYDAKTLADAKASTKTADKDDLTTGCNGFPWSEVTKP
jgi:hypothetical protein